jgi:hypothetical protein
MESLAELRYYLQHLPTSIPQALARDADNEINRA